MLPSPLCALAEESERSISYDEFIPALQASRSAKIAGVSPGYITKTQYPSPRRAKFEYR